MIAQPLDRLIMIEGSTAALLAARLGGLMLTAPMYSSRAVPMKVRTTVLIVLTIALLPAIEPVSVTPTMTTFAIETGIGLTIGLAASFLIAGATAAGDLLAIQMGLSAANVLNPISGESLPILGQFAQLTALTVVLALGGHLVMIEAVGESLAMAPLGQPVEIEGSLRAVVEAASRIFLIAFRFAAPVVAALLLGNVVLGVLGRSVPQMNLLMVAFPVQIGVGLLAFAAALPIMGTLIGSWTFDFAEIFEQLMLALRGG